MTPSNQKHLKKIKRIRITEDRDLRKGLRLNRNEKVSNWDTNILKKIFHNKPGYFLSTYPDNELIYNKLSKFEKIPKSAKSFRKSCCNHESIKCS